MLSGLGSYITSNIFEKATRADVWEDPMSELLDH